MKKIRSDFDVDILAILKKRFKININSSTLYVTKRLNLDDKEIIKIKRSYLDNLNLIHIKKIEKSLENLINECNPKLLYKNVKNIITIIMEMIKPTNNKIGNYITITEFSNITGIKNASIKNTLSQKGYLSSKFKTIPTRTAICKEVVKIKQYKHFKNPELDILFYWRESFLNSILSGINKDMKPIIKTFNYRKPKNIHEAFNSINYVIERIINFNRKLKKRKIYITSKSRWVESTDYYRYMKKEIYFLENELDKNAEEIHQLITNILEYKLTNQSRYIDEDFLSIFDNYKNKKLINLDNSYLYIHSVGYLNINLIPKLESLQSIYYFNGILDLINECNQICNFLMLLNVDIKTRNSAVLAIRSYIEYIKKHRCNNCIQCQRWSNYKNYSHFLLNHKDVINSDYNFYYNCNDDEFDFSPIDIRTDEEYFMNKYSYIY